MVKLKRSPKNLELDITVVKMGNSAASSNFRGKRQIPQRGVKICMPQNTASYANYLCKKARFYSGLSVCKISQELQTDFDDIFKGRMSMLQEQMD